MTADADTLILHQYEISPFSEKVRVALGIKGLSWRACNQPPIMPKPELVRLTGGYRRIPLLQVGADLYFDSLYITEELERRFPQAPSAFSGSGVGLARAFSQWTDGALFMGLVGLLFGGDWKVDQAFLDDRSALIGQPFDPEQFAAGAPGPDASSCASISTCCDEQLADGRAFLTGERPDADRRGGLRPGDLRPLGRRRRRRSDRRLCAGLRLGSQDQGVGPRQAGLRPRSRRRQYPRRGVHPRVRSQGPPATGPSPPATGLREVPRRQQSPAGGRAAAHRPQQPVAETGTTACGDIHLHLPRSVGALQKR